MPKMPAQIAKEAAADVAATNTTLAAKGGVSTLTFIVIRNPRGNHA